MHLKKINKILYGLSLVIICVPLIAMESFGQSFKLMRYDESYYYLKDSSRTFYNKIKLTPVTDTKVYLSFGGEARLEYAIFNNEDWGRLNVGHNNFLLQRYDFHTDFHIGERVRIFAQARSALENGRKNGPRPIDEDKLNIQNLFLDAVVWKRNAKKINIRIGRQEIDYGSGRLISVNEGVNVRLYFTGVKLMYNSGRLSADGFVMMGNNISPGVFDNEIIRRPNLWGLYSRLILSKNNNLDLYYLGIERKGAVFEEGIANETRHTVGARLWKVGNGVIYNIEAAYQFGKFGGGSIDAWTGSAEIGYSFNKVKLKPTINLRNDYISGDKQSGNGKLQTFNPLYPRGGYFGFDPQIGPVNLIDIHPYCTFKLINSVTLQFDVIFNWRYSLNDGVYRPSGSFNLPGSASVKRYVGTAYLAGVVYSLNKFIILNAGLQYFKTGSFLKDIIPAAKDGLFINTRLGFKF